MWVWYFILVLSLSIDSKAVPGGLDKEFKDAIQLNKYSPATRKLVGKTLKALQIFDSYDTSVKSKQQFWVLGSEFSATAIEALGGLKKAEKQFTATISGSLIELKNLQIALQKKPDLVGQIDNKNSPCFMGDNMYSKEDCEKCRKSIPGFKSKAKSMTELRGIILGMQQTIPKQFLYYQNDVFVVVAEAIRIIDKMNDCLKAGGDTSKCSRDKSFLLFTRKMRLIITREKDHVKMVATEATKLKTIVAQLVLEVSSSMEMMTECLWLKKGLSIFDIWKKSNVPSVESAAKNVGMDMSKVKATDSKKVTLQRQRRRSLSVGTKLAQSRRYKL
ncbi:hypothetical protein GE061_007873 [Apolygus lucorum]|uniref:Uncharacterized protein n=1 Tax=Apolygus lucorum TaxID=248454 RepID=A0A8S9WQP3_APOLU|nr:hypothetical protein GE061_007873 [Apolygus lucorum]